MRQDRPVARFRKCLGGFRPLVLAALGLSAMPVGAWAEEARTFSLADFQAELRNIPIPDAPPAEPGALHDPLEAVNRRLHTVNTHITEQILAPAADYLATHSSPAFQDGFANVMANLREPVYAGSALVEGSYAVAGQSTLRFLLNSTVGVLGYRDVAAGMGYPERPRTLGLALCRRGVPSGPYAVLPVFGPSTIRDAGGLAMTTYAQYMVLGPALIPYRALDVLATYIDRRERLRLLDEDAIDAYARYRSAYGQVIALRCGQGPVDGAVAVPG